MFAVCRLVEGGVPRGVLRCDSHISVVLALLCSRRTGGHVGANVLNLGSGDPQRLAVLSFIIGLLRSQTADARETTIVAGMGIMVAEVARFISTWHSGWLVSLPRPGL